jgi:hypothetical protein
MTSACASAYQTGDEAPHDICGTDTSGWIFSEAPANAQEYRQLAAITPVFKSENVSAKEWGRHAEETWLIKSSGGVILCLADGPPWEAWATQFWKFAPPDTETGELSVEDKGATLTVG